jgi:uncharacterized protein
VTLILNEIDPYHWAIAGAGIGAMALLLLWLTGRRLGLSTGYESVCSLVMRGTPYFRRSSLVKSNPWRLPIVIGLVLGGVASALLSGGWAPTWDAGMLDTRIGLGEGGKVAWMFAGGLFMGFGTRLSGGCTSGHGIFGLSNLERSGIVAVVCFMAAGAVTSNLIYRVIFPAGG